MRRRRYDVLQPGRFGQGLPNWLLVSEITRLRNRFRVPVMSTVTKKELIDRIADKTGNKRVVVKRIIQLFLDQIIDELGAGNRLEFRDFGVFESKERAARIAQNPKTLERVEVPQKRTVKFKVGRVMKMRLSEPSSSSRSAAREQFPSGT